MNIEKVVRNNLQKNLCLMSFSMYVNCIFSNKRVEKNVWYSSFSGLHWFFGKYKRTIISFGLGLESNRSFKGHKSCLSQVFGPCIEFLCHRNAV